MLKTLNNMKIAIGSDHAGFELKQEIKSLLTTKGIEVKDFGTFSTESVDYPDYAHPTASAVENNEADLGILLCGTGNGIAMAANKHQGIRAAICWSSEITELVRKHNNANILVLPARIISKEDAFKFVDIFLNTDFEGGRHERRIEKISCSNI